MRRSWRERVMRGLILAMRWRGVGLVIGVTCMVLMIALGADGFTRYFDAQVAEYEAQLRSFEAPRQDQEQRPPRPMPPPLPSASTIAYLAVQLPILQSGALVGPIPWQLDVARFLAPIFAGFAAITVLMNYFADRLVGWRIQQLRGHVVVCGFGIKGAPLVDDLLDRGLSVVVVEQNLRDADIAALGERGAYVLAGDATNPSILRRAGCDRAGFIVVSCGNDATGVEIAMQVVNLTPKARETPPAMYLHLEEPALVGQLQARIRGSSGGRSVAAHDWPIFDLYDRLAKSIVAKHFVFDRAEVKRRTQPNAFAVVRGHELALAVVGDTPLADRLIDNLVEVWRPRRARRRERFRLVVVGRLAQQRIDDLKGRLPDFDTVCNAQVIAHDVLELPPDQRRRLLAGVSTVYVCRETDSTAAATASALWRQADPQRTRMIVSFDRQFGIADLVRQSGVMTAAVTDRLVAFSLAESFIGADLVFDSVTERLAILIRDEFREEVRKAGYTAATHPFLDLRNARAQEIALSSSRKQAQHTLHKLDLIGCEIRPQMGADPAQFTYRADNQADWDEIRDLANLEHDRWADERLLDGWEVGSPTDRTTMIHENLVPWERVPAEVRKNDYDVILKLPLRLARVGFEIVRKPETSSPPGRA